jgi:NADH:ubiquinone oxidoreductase subunit K
MQMTGQIFAIFVITVAAAEAAVGLALIIAIYRLRGTVNLEEVDLLQG